MNASDVSRAIDSLQHAGFEREQISLLMAESTQAKSFKIAQVDKTAEGAVGGGLAGGVLGALAAGLAAVGTVAAPGIGLVAAGPLLAALAGGGAGAAVGGVAGALIGAGIPEHTARVARDQVTRGGILVAVRCDSEQQRGLAEVTLGAAGAASTIKAPA